MALHYMIYILALQLLLYAIPFYNVYDICDMYILTAFKWAIVKIGKEVGKPIGPFFISGSQMPVTLTHWDWDKMAPISQKTFSNAFSWMKMIDFQ